MMSWIAGFLASAVSGEFYTSYTNNDLPSPIATLLAGGLVVSTLTFAILFRLCKEMCVDRSLDGKSNSKIIGRALHLQIM
ncbi:MAG: hypothetical protein WBX01_04395 [Nitrososphaeraceae archaeon]